MESIDDGTGSGRPADAPEGGTREWHAPMLTVLGDVRTLTEAGGLAAIDGVGTQVVS